MIVVDYQNGCLLQPQKDRSKASYDLGPAFWIEKIVQYPNSNMGTRFIFGYNDHNSISGEFEIEAAECYDYRFGLLSMLAKHGLIYDPSWDKALNAYFHNEIRRVTKGRPKEYRHTTLGWRKDNGSYKFFYDVTPLGAYNSRYYDTNFSFKSGSDAVYKKLLDEVVWPCPTLTLAMAIGFSSIVNSRMQDLLAPESILFNLCGASSTGKTTAEMLMVSAFAKPIPSNSSGLIHTFNSTENALYAAIANIHGLPMVLDDTTTNTSLNLPRLLYSLSSNQDKARCTQDGSLKPSTRDWSGTIILSSETPIHELQSENQGLKVRVLHTQGITWTPDAQTAERIKTVVQNNYGHIGYGFAKYVESLDDNNLLNRHTTALNAIKPLMAKKDGLTDRIAAKYAIVGMTLTLMKERFGLTIDETDLMSILIQCEQESFESRDIAQKGLDAIIDFVKVKHSNFEVYGQSRIVPRTFTKEEFSRGDRFGTIVKHNLYAKIFIRTSKVKEILLKEHINEVASVFAKWKERSLIITEKDRNDIKFTGNKNSPDYQKRCICFKVPWELLKDDGADEEPDEDESEVIAAHPVQTPAPCIIDYDDEEALKNFFESKEGTNESDNQKK